jgi:hypothetical protein
MNINQERILAPKPKLDANSVGKRKNVKIPINAPNKANTIGKFLTKETTLTLLTSCFAITKLPLFL